MGVVAGERKSTAGVSVVLGVALAMVGVLFVPLFVCLALSIETAWILLSIRALAHTGSFARTTFDLGVLAGIGVLAFVPTALIAASFAQLRRHDAPELHPWLVRHPILAATLGIGAAAFLSIALEFNAPGWLAFLPVALTGAFAVICGVTCLPWLIWQWVRSLRAVHRLCMRRPFVAELVAGCLITTMAIGGVYVALVLQRPLAATTSSSRHRPDPMLEDLLEAVQADVDTEVDATEQTRLVLEDVAEDLIATDDATPLLATIRLRPTGGDPNDAASDCLEQMYREEVQVQRSLMRKFRMSEEDALDLVRDTIVSLCGQEDPPVFDKPGAALENTAEWRALDGWRKRRSARAGGVKLAADCAVTYPSERVLFERWLRNFDRAFGELSEEDQTMIELCFVELQQDYPAIAKRRRVEVEQARSACWNAMHRLRRQLEIDCRSQ